MSPKYVGGMGLLPDFETERCQKCGGRYKLRNRKRNQKLKFYKRCMSCDTEKSLFSDSFFTYKNELTNKNSVNLDITTLLKLIYSYFEFKTIPIFMRDSGIKSTNTVINWTNFIRERISEFLNSRPKLGGTDSIVEIDETLMRGRRKNHQGRLLIGDFLDYDPNHNSRRQNYGGRVNGPWIFGLIERGTRKSRMFYVEDRRR